MTRGEIPTVHKCNLLDLFISKTGPHDRSYDVMKYIHYILEEELHMILL